MNGENGPLIYIFLASIPTKVRLLDSSIKYFTQT